VFSKPYPVASISIYFRLPRRRLGGGAEIKPMYNQCGVRHCFINIIFLVAVGMNYLSKK
jgi:hypothetical protein